MTPLRLSESLSARILATVGARIAIVVLVATVVSYWHVTNSLETQALEQLDGYVEQRALREGAIFVLARDNLSAFAERFAVRMALDRGLGVNRGERFEELYEQKADGTHRLREVLFHASGLTGVVRKNVPLDAELRALLVSSAEALERFGPSWAHRFANLYVTLPDGAVLMYWPARPWGTTVTDWEIHGKLSLVYPAADVVVTGGPRKSAETSFAWSQPYFDYGIKDWMVSAVEPIQFDGKPVATVAHDILLTELFDRTVNQRLEGTYNLLLREDGQLVVHPRYMDAIQARSGSLHVRETDDGNLQRIYAAITAMEHEHDVLDNADDDEYLGVSRLPGTEWLLVTVYPKALIADRAFATASLILVIGGVALLLELIILFIILRRLIVRPLHQLAMATNRVTSGDFGARLKLERQDELGQLSQAFNSMSSELESRERDLQLRNRELSELNQDLEERVAKRTAELSEAKELAESATRAKSQFLSNMSHELRTPLNAIIGISEMIQEDDEDVKDDSRKEPLGRIVRAGRHLLQLIDGVLDLSKIEAGRMDVEHQSFDVAAMLEQVVDTVRPMAERNGNRLHAHWPSDLGAMVSDVTRVRQMLLNLLSNACKFTQNGEVRLEAEPIAAGERIEFRVSDTGIGIAADQVDNLFTEYGQLRQQTANFYGGTGLGLAITKQLAQLLGGDVAATSEMGRGSCFILRLPTA